MVQFQNQALEDLLSLIRDNDSRHQIPPWPSVFFPLSLESSRILFLRAIPSSAGHYTFGCGIDQRQITVFRLSLELIS